MVLCDQICSPCCDFCIYADHAYLFIEGTAIKCGVKGCKKHPDEHHQSMAQGLGYCKDFYCFNMEEKSDGA